MKPMKVWICQKYDRLKCRSDQPCMIVSPASVKKLRGCPKSLYDKGKWKVVPTTEITV